MLDALDDVSTILSTFAITTMCRDLSSIVRRDKLKKLIFFIFESADVAARAKAAM